MSNILLIDNDQRFFTSVEEVVNRMGHRVVSRQTLADGLKVLAAGSFEVVLLNANLSDGKGIDALPKILEASTVPEVILLTDAGDPDEAELAIRNGAWDYIERPDSVGRFVGTTRSPRPISGFYLIDADNHSAVPPWP